MKRVVRNAATAAATLVSIAVALAIGEAATRYAFRDVTSTASGGNYFLRQAPPIHVNRDGYREREFIVPKPRGLYRVVVVGDSITNGAGLPDSQRFTALLDERLRSEHGEVLNLGLPGQDLPQYLEELTGDALPLDPDFIVLQLFVNDFEGPHAERARSAGGFLSELHRALLLRSALYTVASIEWGTIEGETGMVEAYPDFVRRTLGGPDNSAWNEAKDTLVQIVRTCRAAHRPLGIVFFPHLSFNLDHTYPFAFLHERVERICRDEQVPFLDMRPVYSGARLDTLQLNRFDAHPSAKACRMAAAAMLATFGTQWHAAAHAHP